MHVATIASSFDTLFRTTHLSSFAPHLSSKDLKDAFGKRYFLFVRQYLDKLFEHCQRVYAAERRGSPWALAIGAL